MDGARIQQRIWGGYAKSAAVLGSSYQFSRPASGNTPAVWKDPNTHQLNNPLFARNVSLNAEDMKYGRPSKYGKSTSYALVDGSSLQPGDYFVGAEGTFFIAGMQALLPILAVECNRTVTLSRVPQQTAVGASGYSGMTSANEIPYVTGVPCSILQGTKGEKNEANLPGDVRTPWWALLMPASVGNILYGDLIVDDLGRRYVASSVELTNLGYRLTAVQSNT
jgi:hypothetical protein